MHLDVVAEQAAAFSGKLVPMGANLSQIANEPPKLLSKLQTVHWMLFHSEGRPPESAYDVVDMLEEKIDALIEEKTQLADDILVGGAEKMLTEMSDAELVRLVALDIDRARV